MGEDVVVDVSGRVFSLVRWADEVFVSSSSF